MPLDLPAIAKIYKLHDIAIDERKIQKAIDFAKIHHGTQKRESGEPYYNHPLEVAGIIAEMRLDTDSIVAAILHDTIEDTDLTLREIEEIFGKNVALLVSSVTKLTKIKFKEDNVRQAENFRKLLIAMSNDIRVLLIKLADRLHNMRTIDFISSPQKRHRVALETLEIYAPLAERIGINRIKTELQDICFRVLNPDIRNSIIQRFESIETGQDKFIPQIISEITRVLKSHGLKAEVSGRRKTAYSIWMKMKQKNITINQLFDIMAFRVMVDTTEDCYRSLGIIHGEYKMVPETFQDFISTPKNNGYQSLHTVVMGPLRQKIEIQIRTSKMHDIAELGVAAHWLYKQNTKNTLDSKNYKWIRELLSILEQNNDHDTFLRNTKLAMYYDQVFCFTLGGELIALPKGATTVDFAYAIHSDIGNKCVSAKINGKIVPLKTQLINGDQIEIVTSNHQTASPLWKKFVVTGKAMGEIQKAIHNQQRYQYVTLGKTMVKKALKVNKIDNESKAISSACKLFNKSSDELLFAVGKGTITQKNILDKIMPKKSRLNSTLSLLKLDKAFSPELKQENSITIKGLINGMAMHYAKCCHPLPGDRIVGVFHTGSGVTIHTSDCKTLNEFSTTPDRLIEVTWDENRSNIPFVSRIKILLLNQPGSLAVMAETVAKSGSNIVNFKIVNRNNNYFEILFDIEVNSAQQAEDVINSLRIHNEVQYVDRNQQSIASYKATL